MTACGGGGGGDSSSEAGGSGTTKPDTGSSALQILVPAYFYPSTKDSQWDVLSAGAQAYPDVKITAILNPSNGIFDKANPAFTAAIQDFESHGGKLLGYVNTKYGTRTAQAVQSNIDDYLKFYPSIQGLFLDEMDAHGSEISFYRQVAAHIRAQSSKLQIVGNPGTPSTSDYAAVADTLVSFEGKEVDYRKLDPERTHSWIYQLPTSSNAVLIHDADSCELMQSTLRSAKTTQAHIGYVYVTDRQYDYQNNVGNPWATLPSYWLKMLQTVDALNKGQPLPSCTSPS